MYEEELDEDGVEYYAIRPNKSQIKREIAELNAFIEQLIALSPAQLALFELEDIVFKAIVTASGLPPTGARKRQIKYINGLLRKLDISELQEQLARLQSKSAHAVREHHVAERWREQLLLGDENAVSDFLAEYPAAQRQELRNLVRSAKKEQSLNAPPKHARLLYRYIKDIIEQG